MAAKRARSSLIALRVVELVLFALCTGAIALYGLEHASSSDGWLRTTLQLSVVVMAYGVLIPNTGTRAILVITFLTLASAAAVVAIQLRSTGALAEDSAGPLIVLGLAALVSMAGAGVIAIFRTVAVKTRTANMYDLVYPLGRGGMGEVWRAQHQRLARPAAIKIIRPDILDEDPIRATSLRKSLEEEARTTAQLRSPNTIEVYDFGTTSDGTFYYVMEYLDGIDLESLIARFGPITPGRLVFLLEQVCLSLADAHDHGLVHRDVKPANIFISRMGLNFDYVKVLDFGLARPVSKLDDDGLVSGTPAYLSPEAITGEHDLDARADIYALGCVAYYAATGELVFAERDIVALAAAHVGTEPVRPSLRVETPIPPELEAIIMRCLDKDPGKRFANARELASAFSELRLKLHWTALDSENWWIRNHPVPTASMETLTDVPLASSASDVAAP